MSDKIIDNNKPDDKNQQIDQPEMKADRVEKALEDGGSSSTETNPTTTTAGSWLPDASWASSLVVTAKEKTKSTIETMKKDIHEISDTLQHGANTLASATVKQAQIIQQMIVPVSEEQTDQKLKDDESVPNPPANASDDATKGNNASGGLFGMGWMKQVVDTVHKFATEDTTSGEAECTEEIRVGPGGRLTLLDQCTLLQMQNDARTFLQPPQQNVDLYKEWLGDFKLTEYNGEINMLLGCNPRLREIYAELVPSEVDNNTFWNRYFFKVHLKELDKQIAAGMAPKLNLDKLGASSAGHSPAPSNGKDDWSMCSSGAATEAEDIENGAAIVVEREDASTPRPRKQVQKADEEVDDWEECEEDNAAAVEDDDEGMETAAKAK